MAKEKGSSGSNKLVSSVKNLGVTVVKEWSVPGRGNYVPNKEILAFAGGGMGVKGLIGLGGYFVLTVGQWLIGLVYGISATNLFILTLISNIVCILKAPVASWIVDNTHTSIGKFRPYFLFAGLVSLLGVFGLVFAVPVDGTELQKMIVIAVFYNIYIVAQQIYGNAYTGLAQVITPKSGERNKILSLSEFLANLGPSILQLFLPICVGFFVGGESNITAYRVVFPIFGCLCFALGLVVMAFTKERVVLPKISKNRIKFIDGLRTVGKNRDFWIVALSRMFYGFKGGVAMMLLYWLVHYSLNLTSEAAGAVLGTFSTICATGFIPGMLLAPILMKKLGSGNAMALSFITNALAAVVMLVSYKNIYLFAIALWLFNFASGPQYVIQTAITADALDDIQFKKGRRVEAFATNLQQMSELFGNTVSALAMMLVYNACGLGFINTGEGYYTAMLDAAIRNPIVTYTILFSIVASVICALPFFFIKMTAKKHAEIVVELEKRKFYEDRKELNFTADEMHVLYKGYLDAINAEEKVHSIDVERSQFLTEKAVMDLPKEMREEAYQNYFEMRSEWDAVTNRNEAKRAFAMLHKAKKFETAEIGGLKLEGANKKENARINAKYIEFRKAFELEYADMCWNLQEFDAAFKKFMFDEYAEQFNENGQSPKYHMNDAELEVAFAKHMAEKEADNAKFIEDLAALKIVEIERSEAVAAVNEKKEFYDIKRIMKVQEDEIDRLFAAHLDKKLQAKATVAAEKEEFFSKMRAENVEEKEIEKQYEDMMIEKDKADTVIAAAKAKADKKTPEGKALKKEKKAAAKAAEKAADIAVKEIEKKAAEVEKAEKDALKEAKKAAKKADTNKK